jgi:aerobic-type carbon monoxide dehydrogenase small subunit (CoxS/CutS family)
MTKTMVLLVNGARHPVTTDPERSLLSVLREDLDLIGTKYGCGEAQCAACTVLIAGQPTHACITPVSDVVGKPITTIEGLAQNGRLHPVQEAFLEFGAMQCGYCTPGMIMAGVGLLAQNPDPSEQEIIRTMNGNLCRCGTYPRIVAAIRKAAAAHKKEAAR